MKETSQEELVKRQFDPLLKSILKVVQSCRTEKQLDNAYRWGTDVVLQLTDLIERTFPLASIRYALSYKYYICAQIKSCYLSMRDNVEAVPEIPNEKVTIREKEPHISVCRTCSGKGVTTHISGRTCPTCGGSGRVKVSSVIKSLIQPYDPDKDDPLMAVKMD